MKELGPEGGPSKKASVAGEGGNPLAKDNDKYRNAELAMLCSVIIFVISNVLI